MALELYIHPCIQVPRHRLHPPSPDLPLRIRIQGPLQSIEKLLSGATMPKVGPFPQPGGIALARLTHEALFGKTVHAETGCGLVVRDEYLAWAMSGRRPLDYIDYYGFTFDHLVHPDDCDPEVLVINMIELDADEGVYADGGFISTSKRFHHCDPHVEITHAPSALPLASESTTTTSPPPTMLSLAILPALAALVAATDIDHTALPSYHYGAPIQIECMNRSSETGEHIEDNNHQFQWIPFPVCKESGKPLEFGYGIEGEVNCTIPISHDFFHLLEFYIHSDAPLSCRLPARPPAVVSVIGEAPPPQEHIPLVFAMAGTLQLSHMHVSTHMNVLLHAVPKHHVHHHDSGVLDSAISYSTSPLSHMEGAESTKLTIGEPLPLRFSVRWFPTPHLPHSEGRVEWQGLGGHIYASTFFYSLVAFIAGALVAAMYTLGVVLPRRLRDRALGGATPLGHGLGNGWGYSKRID